MVLLSSSTSSPLCMFKSLPRFRLLGSAAAVIITASCALTTSTQQQPQNAVLPGQLQQQAMPQQETANGFIAPGTLQQQAGSSVMGAPPASAVQPYPQAQLATSPQQHASFGTQSVVPRQASPMPQQQQPLAAMALTSQHVATPQVQQNPLIQQTSPALNALPAEQAPPAQQAPPPQQAPPAQQPSPAQQAPPVQQGPLAKQASLIRDSSSIQETPTLQTTLVQAPVQASTTTSSPLPPTEATPGALGGPPGALGAVTSSAITPTATPSGATEKARFPAWAIVLIVVSAVLLIVGGVMIRWWLNKRRNARARANVQAYYKGRRLDRSVSPSPSALQGRQDPPHSHYARFLKVDDIASSIASTSEAESNADRAHPSSHDHHHHHHHHRRKEPSDSRHQPHHAHHAHHHHSGRSEASSRSPEPARASRYKHRTLRH